MHVSPLSRPQLSRRRSRTRRTLILLAALNLAACTAWQPTTTPLPRVVEEEALSTIRVTLQDATELEVKNPAIVGDTLYSRQRGQMPVARATVEDVRSVAVQEGQAGTTVLVVTGLTLTILTLISVSNIEFGWGESS